MEKDDNNPRRFDIGILSYALSRYFCSGKPGIASLLCGLTPKAPA
jgi:hypothetical protein